MRKIFFALVFIMIFLVGCATQPIASSTEPETLPGAIKVTPAAFDFGDIPQQGGLVSTTFTIQNIGTETLIMNRLSTSCGCTTATMDMADLTPNETRTMAVTFDPMAHPEVNGPIERVIYLQTSDPNVPEIQIDITGNVIPDVI